MPQTSRDGMGAGPHRTMFHSPRQTASPTLYFSESSSVPRPDKLARVLGFAAVVLLTITVCGAAQEFEAAKLVSSNLTAGDEFGFAVAIRGRDAIIGARFAGQGGTTEGRVFTFAGAQGSWAQQATIVSSDAASGDRFGGAVFLDGDDLLVGVYGDGDAGTWSGSAYFFSRGSSSWSEGQKITASDAAAADQFGHSAAMDGDYAIVGSLGDDDGGSRSGSAYIFVRSAGTWSQQDKLTADDAAANDVFGQVVAISGDYALAGAPGDDSSSGSAYVFKRNAAAWTQEAKLVAADRAAGDALGTSVAIYGAYAVVGAPGDDSATGAAYVFKRAGVTWTQVAKLTASDAAAADDFGTSVAIRSNQLVVGAPGEENDRGAVYLFEELQGTWVEVAKFAAGEGISGDRLGYSVSLSSDQVLAGAVGVANGAGAAYVFSGIRFDCDGNGIPDACDVSCQAVSPVSGQSCFIDFNAACGTQPDCNANAVPDACEPDCNSNGVADACDISGGTSADCDTNGNPDECDTDCNTNGVPDACDISGGGGGDCNLNGVPDECELVVSKTLLSAGFDSALPVGWSATGLWHVSGACARPGACDPSNWAYFGRDADCNFSTNGAAAGVLLAPPLAIPSKMTAATLTYCSFYEAEGGAAPAGLDAAWLAVNGVVTDDVGAAGATGTWQTRSVDLSSYIGQSVTLSWHFDSRDPGFNDTLGWQIDRIVLSATRGVNNDCNTNGVLDECDIGTGQSTDCNSNSLPDECEIARGSSEDCNGNNLPDECEPGNDCNFNGTPDICEVQIEYVNSAAGGMNDGSSWTDAYTDLQDALGEASAECLPTEIWVAAGAYAPDGAAGDRAATFTLLSGVAVYGGFSGTETKRVQRNPDPATNGTVLTGDLNGDDGSAALADNSYHVVTADGTDGTAVVDGFTIKAGVADGTSPHDRGAALFVDTGGPSVRNCLFSGHQAGAGAVYLKTSDVSFTDCCFVGNTARFGGAIYMITTSTPTLTGCKFIGNDATMDSAGGGAGGGVFVSSASTPVFVNCAFSGNAAIADTGHAFTADGGALYVASSSTPSLINCTLSRNSAADLGGGMVALSSSVIRLTNSVLWGNSDAGGIDESAQIHVDSATLTLAYTCVEGLTGAFGGAGNIGTDPLLADADGADNVVGTSDDDLRLAAGSPCIDAGSNGASAGGPPPVTDLGDMPRFIDDPHTPDTGAGSPPIIDMGAHEFQTDCNSNGVADFTDVTAGTSGDCNTNLVPDECEIRAASTAPGGPFLCTANCAADCNSNGVPDACDVAGATSADCTGDGTPDECASDCDGNGIADGCEIAAGTSADCNTNGLPDECELAGNDCDSNGLLDSCDLWSPFVSEQSGQMSPVTGGSPLSFTISSPRPAVDNVTLTFFAVADLSHTSETIAVDLNGVDIGTVFASGAGDCPAVPDQDQLVLDAATFNNAVGGGDAVIRLLPAPNVDVICATYIQVFVQYLAFRDCNLNSVPDVCEPDCNTNGLPDECDISAGSSADCNGNGVPDSCDLAGNTSTDANVNAVPDECELDCDSNGVPDECDLSCAASNVSTGNPCNVDFPGACGGAADCDANGVPDACDPDCNTNGLVDACETAAGTSTDCNSNGTPDVCDLAEATGADCNADGVPDECQPDADGDGAIDDCDNCPGDPVKTEPGVCGCGVSDTLDSDGDGVIDCLDTCPGTPAQVQVDASGCPFEGACCIALTVCAVGPPGTCGTLGGSYRGNGTTCATDYDGDTVPDCDEQCPDDPAKTGPGVCGCGFADSDADTDGVSDCIDQCPGTSVGEAVDSNGCPFYGACCASGVCLEAIPQAICEVAADVYRGNGTTCGVGDYDADCDVDLDDYAQFAGCASGPQGAAGFTAPSTACLTVFDFDDDSDVDARDYAAFQRAFTN